MDRSALNLNFLLRQSSIRKITDGCKLASIILIIIFLAAIFRELLDQTISESLLNSASTGVTTQSPIAPGQSTETRDYALIYKRNVFGPLTKEQATSKPKPAPKPETKLALTLIGTFLSGSEDPYAIIESKKSKEQDVFSPGDSIFDAAKLVAIFNDRVDIDRNGTIETLPLEEGSDGSLGDGETVASAGEDSFMVSEAEVDKALENLPLLLSQARAVPYFKNGKSVGLRLFAIKRGSLYEKIGLKNGDILKTINGNSLGDITQAVKLFEKLKEEREIALVLERNGQTKRFSYEIS